MGQLTIPIRK